MPQDAFTLRFVAKELSDALRGGKINKINQPEREELSLLIYTGTRTLKLVLNANASDCGAYFSAEERENPLAAPNFCMLLRKYIQNAEILAVEQVKFERILCFRLLCRSDFSACERLLYAEIMGKYSNLILTENGTILGAMKTTSLGEGCKRLLMPGAAYVLPAPQDKTDPCDEAALARLMESAPRGEDELSRFLFLHVAGIAPCTAEQIASSCGGHATAERVRRFLFSEETFPCVTERNGMPVDFLAQKAPGAIPFDTLSAAQEYFYRKKRGKKRTDAFRRRLESAVKAIQKKQEKRLSQILEKYRECADMEQTRIKGELITANLYALARGQRACELVDYYDPDGKTVKIALDESLTPSQNAQRYFKKYQKQKRTLAALEPQEKALRTELAYTESLLSAVRAAETDEDMRSLEEELLAARYLKAQDERKKKGKKQETPGFRVFERDGFRILSGRNNLQNDRLVRAAAPDDVWLHAQKYHSSHVVIQTNGRAVPDEVLAYAAAVCARYSDGKQGTKIPVDYCPARFVRKPSGAKAGFVVYTDYKTVLADPLPEGEADPFSSATDGTLP